MILLAIDPGKKPGWAVFQGEELVACGAGLAPLYLSDVLVIERPSARGGNTRTPVEDLIALSIEAGRALGRHEANAGEVRWRPPGGLKKEVRHRRARCALTETERALARDATPDTWCAIALGLREVGRMG